MSEITRKLASFRTVKEIQPIAGADAIEVVVIDGWKVVTKKGEFNAGDLCVYLEIDSWVPTALAPFLSKGKEPREFQGVKGERLRTVKLRGQISQGLALPVDVVPVGVKVKDGVDLTKELNILKWELPDGDYKAGAAGQTKGVFPSFIPKTDQARIQNCFDSLRGRHMEDDFEATLKLDGSSCTIFFNKGEFGVCSRNLQLDMYEKPDWKMKIKTWMNRVVKTKFDVSPKLVKGAVDNHFVRAALMAKDVLVASGRNLAVQGEVMGPGIQKNREGFKDIQFFVFDMWDIDAQKYLAPAERRALCASFGLKHAPVLAEHFEFFKFTNTVDEALANAEIKSINNPIAEGIVYKSNKDPSVSFKCINNRYLLKEE